MAPAEKSATEDAAANKGNVPQVVLKTPRSAALVVYASTRRQTAAIVVDVTKLVAPLKYVSKGNAIAQEDSCHVEALATTPKHPYNIVVDVESPVSLVSDVTKVLARDAQILLHFVALNVAPPPLFATTSNASTYHKTGTTVGK